jgi:2,3-bisphosphoglycerate-independent phosphoglycerate mutase
MPFDYIPPLLNNSKKKIVLLVMDGLGGLPLEPGGKTELETASTPNIDSLAAQGVLGETVPIAPGITPGSGPAHLALFGYDPLVHAIGRGVLSAAGIGVQVNPGDVAARGNFCTLDVEGKIVDRRAGRIPTEVARPLVEKLRTVQVPGMTVEVNVVKEYRFSIVLRGENLNAALEDTDPQTTGVAPYPVRARTPEAQHTADLLNRWVAEARKVLADEPKANGFTLRGFATDPGLQPYAEAYGLKAACIAVYPMYRGVASLVGMEVIDFDGDHPEDEFAALASVWDAYDFFFVHIKKTDSMGEDGNFEGKVKIIESVDAALPDLLALNPDVLIITGDHSTPAKLKSHSWHPVPFLLWAPETAIPDGQAQFGERACQQGGLGTFPALDTMPLALAHAERLNKYGA